MSEKSLNIGEADELLFKLNLIYLKESNKELPKIGKISKLSMGDEYKSNNLKIDDLNDIYQKINDIEVQQKLKIACNESNITKAPSGAAKVNCKDLSASDLLSFGVSGREEEVSIMIMLFFAGDVGGVD